MNDFDSQVPTFGLDHDFRGITPTENLIFSLRLMLGVQIVYEYFTNFNAFALFIRFFQFLLIVQGSKNPISMSRRARERKERLLNGIVSILHIPVIIFQLTYRKMEPLVIVFIGKATSAPLWQILIQDLLIIGLCYVLIKFRPPDNTEFLHHNDAHYIVEL